MNATVPLETQETDKSRSRLLRWWMLLLILAFGVAGAEMARRWQLWRTPAPSTHRHDAGQHGGFIVSVGHDHYHVEAVFEKEGVFRLFTLDHDQALVKSVPLQEVTAYVRSADKLESVPIVLTPRRQPGDPDHETSAFEGQMPLELIGSRLMVVVPSIRIGSERYRFGFLAEAEEDAIMPQKITSEAERQLYLVPGGKYTSADIQANGGVTASQKFRGFRSDHNMHPGPGEALCPITTTKGNPNCTWIINGQQYTFCCPPCIDEFVKMAKEHPETILSPDVYVQK